MTGFKAVATDLDGTLLNVNGQLTLETLRIVERLSARGIKLFICSARPPSAIYPIVSKLGLSTPIIAYNGASITSYNGRENYRSLYITPLNTHRIVHIVRQLTLPVNIYVDNEWYVDAINEYTQRESKLVGLIPKQVKEWDSILKGKGVSKVLVFYEPKQRCFLDQALSNIDALDVIASNSKDGYLEFLPRGAQKSIALGIVLQMYNIAPLEIVAIGDNYNDIDMFEIAGYSIALGNAPSGVKVHADHIALPNTENGFADAVNHLLKTEI